jgi:hypothetical protein
MDWPQVPVPAYRTVTTMPLPGQTGNGKHVTRYHRLTAPPGHHLPLLAGNGCDIAWTGRRPSTRYEEARYEPADIPASTQSSNQHLIPPTAKRASFGRKDVHSQMGLCRQQQNRQPMQHPPHHPALPPQPPGQRRSRVVIGRAAGSGLAVADLLAPAEAAWGVGRRLVDEARREAVHQGHEIVRVRCPHEPLDDPRCVRHQKSPPTGYTGLYLI